MATLRTLHKRRKRKAMIAALPCRHITLVRQEEGERCLFCGYLYAHYWICGSIRDELPELPMDFDWDAENEEWCNYCDEPYYSCICGEPIDLEDYLP